MPEYIYNDEDGNPSSKVVRRPNKKFHIEHVSEEGSWSPGRGNAPHLPYHLDEVLAADPSKTVYVCEGEHDVDKARSKGLIATCNQGGAGKWTDADSRFLSGRNVVIVYDLDEPGARHAIKVYTSLMRCGAKSARFKHAYEGNDLADHINAGYPIKKLVIEHPTAVFPEVERAERNGKLGHKLDLGYLPGMLQLVLEKLEGVTQEGGKQYQYNALCPAHDDHSPSLSVSLGEDGQILLKCQADCDFYRIADALQINPQDLMRKQLLSEEDKLTERRIVQKRADMRATAILQTELSGNIASVSELARSLDEKLADPPPPTKFLVDGLIRDHGKVLLSAQPKAGKTRLILSLCKVVCDRESAFLGRQVIVPERASVVWSNLDMDEQMSYDWTEQLGFVHPENLVVIDGDGYTLPIWEKQSRDQHVELFRERNVCLWVVDTLAAAAQGLITNENDNIEWYKFFNAVNQIRVAAGWPAVLFTHHTSRADDLHARGASAIEGWFAELWYLTLEGDDAARFSQDSPRVLRVQGRDGHIAAAQLSYNMATGLYSYGGLTAREQRKLELLGAFGARVVDWHNENGAWPSKVEVRGLMRGVRSNARDAWIDDAVARGFVKRFRDGKALRYRV